MGAPAPRPATYPDHLAVEAATEVRHEYVDGQIWAMGGGSPRHSRIETNLVVDVANRLGDAGPCHVYDTDLRVRVLATGLATYPDLTVVWGPLERHPEDPDAITNPTVVVEVLSPSTEGWNRGGKFRHLGQAPLPSAGGCGT